MCASIFLKLISVILTRQGESVGVYASSWWSHGNWIWSIRQTPSYLYYTIATSSKKSDNVKCETENSDGIQFRNVWGLSNTLWYLLIRTDLNLRGWFYTNIILFFTKWSQIGVHKLRLGLIGNILRGAFFGVRSPPVPPPPKKQSWKCNCVGIWYF